jgi:hypothetical protein
MHVDPFFVSHGVGKGICLNASSLSQSNMRENLRVAYGSDSRERKKGKSEDHQNKTE